MKSILLTLVTLGCLNAFAVERDVVIECNLTTHQSNLVQKIQLYALTDEIVLNFRDGTSEVVRPESGKMLGVFEEENFTTDLAWNNGQVFASTRSIGPIAVKYRCFDSPTVPYERCLSQGLKEYAKFAGVTINLNGKILNFKGKNVCTRTDFSPL